MSVSNVTAAPPRPQSLRIQGLVLRAWWGIGFQSLFFTHRDEIALFILLSCPVVPVVQLCQCIKNTIPHKKAPMDCPYLVFCGLFCQPNTQ